MPPKVTREQAFAWVDAHPEFEGRTAQSKAASEALGVPDRTIRAWLKDRAGGVSTPLPPEKWKRKGGTAPAEKMPEADRAQAVKRVRRYYAIVDLVAESIEKELRQLVDEEHDPRRIDLDPKTAAALLSLTRAATETLEAHPGLLDLVKAEEGATGDERAERRRRLLDAVPKGRSR